jgi:leucyl/phenylalanyl-tRNA--protein transferase
MSRSDEIRFFPPIDAATEDGLLMIGGKLNVHWVLSAYRRGIFPWPLVDGDAEILAWFCPDPRAVVELDALYVSRRLARRIRSGVFRTTCNENFDGVIRGCAAPRRCESLTWITPRMVSVYGQLHRLGHAHSIEVWEDHRLVGGLYGIAIGAFFAGESMFHLQRDASKVALVTLVAHLRAKGFELFDIQQTTSHAISMGASEIARDEFLARLEHAIQQPVAFGNNLDLSQLNDIIRR